MDNRIRKLRETTSQLKDAKGHFFWFQNLDGDTIASVSWCVNVSKGKQWLVLEINNGEQEQLANLVTTYLGAKPFAERFDMEMIKFMFEHYARIEHIEIIDK